MPSYNGRGVAPSYLIGLKRITNKTNKLLPIRVGESKKVTFTIDTEKLGYYDRDCKYNVDGGEFIFYVTGDGKNFKEIPLCIEVD